MGGASVCVVASSFITSPLVVLRSISLVLRQREKRDNALRIAYLHL